METMMIALDISLRLTLNVESLNIYGTVGKTSHVRSVRSKYASIVSDFISKRYFVHRIHQVSKVVGKSAIDISGQKSQE